MRVTGCLDACEHANVIVIQPCAAGRAAGGRPVWLGLVNDPDAADDIATWIPAGGPGLADPPGVLDLYAFTPSRRIRQAVDDWPLPLRDQCWHRVPRALRRRRSVSPGDVHAQSAAVPPSRLRSGTPVVCRPRGLV
nr:hypothetical protein StreXyl84_78880 [Streptomyces sp. Xyl84]